MPAKRRKVDPRPLSSAEAARLANLEELLGPVTSCMLCDRNISKSVKVKDMSSKSSVVFCIDCLCKGTEKEGVDHKRDCEYFIYDSLKYPLLTKDWTAQETLLLMQGIMKCGMGNWTDVASQFVKTKTPEECEILYLSKLYVPGDQPCSYEYVLARRDPDGRHEWNEDV
jgi:hypothetical protein